MAVNHRWVRFAACIGLALILPRYTGAGIPPRPQVRVPPRIASLVHNVAPAHPKHVAKKTYAGAKKVVVKLLSLLPPDRYFYLGIGRSPGHLIGLMQAISPDLALTFPGGGLGKQQQHKLIDQNFALYRAHFEALLPESVLRGDRKILVIDHTRGHSTNNFSYALKRYLREVDSAVAVETLSFHTKHNSRSTHHYIRGSWGIRKGKWSEYDYSSHQIGKDESATVENLKARSDWPELVAEYRQWIASDSSMAGVVSALQQRIAKPGHAAPVAATTPAPQKVRGVQRGPTRSKPVRAIGGPGANDLPPEPNPSTSNAPKRRLLMEAHQIYLQGDLEGALTRLREAELSGSTPTIDYQSSLVFFGLAQHGARSGGDPQQTLQYLQLAKAHAQSYLEQVTEGRRVPYLRRLLKAELDPLARRLKEELAAPAGAVAGPAQPSGKRADLDDSLQSVRSRRPPATVDTAHLQKSLARLLSFAPRAKMPRRASQKRDRMQMAASDQAAGKFSLAVSQLERIQAGPDGPMVDYQLALAYVGLARSHLVGEMNWGAMLRELGLARTRIKAFLSEVRIGKRSEFAEHLLKELDDVL